MPIGFWAISRNEVKELYTFYGDDKVEPTTAEIDRMVKRLREELDLKVEQVVRQTLADRYGA